jgi:hypothetical protein
VAFDGLEGTIPKAFYHLTALTYLDLSNNPDITKLPHFGKLRRQPEEAGVRDELVVRLPQAQRIRSACRGPGVSAVCQLEEPVIGWCFPRGMCP